jgi:glutamate formiminotransferase
MAKLIECVPNFSEGRREEVIDAIVTEISNIEGVRVLDKQLDATHNRAVVTFIGAPEAVKRAAYAGVAKAAELIDMELHEGAHPRIGAADVVPLIPISETSIDECVTLARELGREIGERLGIPVYLYGAAALRPDRENLAIVRKGEYESLKRDICTNPDKKPDFGPSKLHPRAGATAVGARTVLVAFNVYLATGDIEVARRIAKAIRHASGGLRYIKAMGVEMKERGEVQVSMNVLNPGATPLYRVFELIKSEAKRYGVAVTSSEIVGLVPLSALVDAAEYYLQLENFNINQVLETRLWEKER